MKKLISILLVLAMVLALAPMALASEEAVVEEAEEIVIDEPIDEPAEEITEEPVDEAAEEEPFEEPIDEPADEPPIDEPADGPEDIWAAITALEESAGAYCPEDYDALLPQVEEIILSSPAYVEGTLEYRDGILFWWSDGVLNGYSPEARAQDNGYAEFDEDDLYLTALLEDQLALLEADMAEAPALDGAGGSGYDVAVFRPYSGYSGDTIPQEFRYIGGMLAFGTGGECHVYEAQDATIDVLADALESCAAVLIHTHGHDGYLCLTTGDGITQADMQNSHAFDSGTSKQADNHHVWRVDGTAIVNHMEKKANDCLVWAGACESMKTDRTCAPLRSNGAAVVVGFSESVSSVGNAAFASAFVYNLVNRNCTAAEAFDSMREACSCDWDPLYPNYTLDQAQRYGVAFPVLVSAQDPYPGAGRVSVVQDPKSTWTLPRNKTDYLPDHSTSLQEITVNTDPGDYIAPVKTRETFQSVVCTSGALPKGMSWSWSGNELHFKGTPTEKGYFSASFKITTVSGEVYTHNAYFMVKDSKVTTSAQTATVTAPSGKDRYYLTQAEYYYISLSFPGVTTTWSMEQIAGYLPASLYYGFSDGARGYVRSEVNTSSPGTYLATYPGSYTATFEIIDYDGNVFRHTLNLTVKPAGVTVMNPISVTATQFQAYSGQIGDHDVGTIQLVSGSLPDGLFVGSSGLRPFGIYGTPTEAGDFTATYYITRYNNAYTYTFHVHVKEGQPQTLTSAAIDLTAPKAGSSIPYPTTGKPASGAHFTIEEQFWSDGMSTSGKLTSGTFKNGTTYYWYAKLVPEKGYAFAGTSGRIGDEVSVTANGVEAYSKAKGGDGYLVVYIPMKATGPAYTGNVVIGGFTEPAAGAAVKSTAVSASTSYSISKQYWSDGLLGLSATKDVSFQAGKTYYWICDVKLSDGYGFPEDYSGTVTLNGKNLAFQSIEDAAAAAMNGEPVRYRIITGDTLAISVSYTTGAAEPPTLTFASDAKSVKASGDFSGLYARVALVLDNNGVSGLYITQATINDDGTILIPEFKVPGLKVKGVNVALVPTLADIQSTTPNARAMATKMLST